MKAGNKKWENNIIQNGGQTLKDDRAKHDEKRGRPSYWRAPNLNELSKAHR